MKLLRTLQHHLLLGALVLSPSLFLHTSAPAPVVECQSPAPAAPVMAYPNPFTDFLHVEVRGYMGKPIVVELRQTMNGTPVLQQAVTYNGPVHMNTSTLAPGWYVLVVTYQGHTVGMREVLKNIVH